MSIEWGNKKIYIYSVSKAGYDLANKIKEIIPCNSEIFTLKKYTQKDNEVLNMKLKEHVNLNFAKVDLMIFVMATGICVRCISQSINNKSKDPAVIVIDEVGKNTISLLSGHIGRANEYTSFLSGKLENRAVITTATDLNNKWGIDTFAEKLGLYLNDLKKAKEFTSYILNEGKISLISDWEIKVPLKESFDENIKSSYTLYLSNKNKILKRNELQLYKRNIILGIGCKKNTNIINLENFILSELDKKNLSIYSVREIASIDLKEHESCLIEISKKYNWKFTVYSAQRLTQESNRFAGSDFVLKITGVSSVCEPSGYIASNRGNKILAKEKNNGITLSIWEDKNE